MLLTFSAISSQTFLSQLFEVCSWTASLTRPPSIKLHLSPPKTKRSLRSLVPSRPRRFRMWDVTSQACRENSLRKPRAIVLGSKPSQVTRIARTGLGTRQASAEEREIASCFSDHSTVFDLYDNKLLSQREAKWFEWLTTFKYKVALFSTH